MADKKQLRALRAELLRQGWTLRPTKTGGGHEMWRAPRPEDGSVTLSLTPSDHRAWANTISQFRRAGFIWPPPPK